MAFPDNISLTIVFTASAYLFIVYMILFMVQRYRRTS